MGAVFWDGTSFFVKRCELWYLFSEKNRKCGIIACFRQKSLLCLYTVLLYRLTGKLINYYRKPSKLRIVQWRATPSGSFREPVDYKGREPSNLVFSEFRRSLLYSKTFSHTTRACISDASPCLFVAGYLLSVISKGTLIDTPLFIISIMLLSMQGVSCRCLPTIRCSSCIMKLLLGNEQRITVLLSNCSVAPFLLFSMWLGIGISAAVLSCA